MNKQFKRINGDTTSFGEDSFPVFTAVKQTHRHTIFLDNHISGPEDMRYAVQTFLMAEPDDEIVVIASGPGGSVDGGLSFINAMVQCPAQVHFMGSGTLASMHAIILCASESFQLDPFANILFHSVSFGTAGPAIDVVEYSEFTKKSSEAMMEYYCIGVLTSDELTEIFKHKKEMWIDTKDFTERFRRKIKCQDRLSEYVEESGINTQDITPDVYVDLMKVMLKEYEEEEAAKKLKKPSRKPAVKKTTKDGCCSSC